MERKDIILIAIFGTIRTFIVLIGIAAWFYLRAKKIKQWNNDLKK